MNWRSTNGRLPRTISAPVPCLGEADAKRGKKRHSQGFLEKGHVLHLLCIYYVSIMYNYMPFYAILCHSMPFYAILCHSMPFYAILCHSMPFYAILCHSMPFYAILCHSMPFYAYVIICAYYIAGLVHAYGISRAID